MRKARTYDHVKKSWYRENGKEFFCRSQFEYRFAQYLQFLKDRGEIKEWNHEPKTFWFPVKRGTNNYLPDFYVTRNNGSTYFVECKGFLTAKDKTKIKRMKKYYPKVELRLLMQKDFKKNIYNKLNGIIKFI